MGIKNARSARNFISVNIVYVGLFSPNQPLLVHFCPKTVQICPLYQELKSKTEVLNPKSQVKLLSIIPNRSLDPKQISFDC